MNIKKISQLANIKLTPDEEKTYSIQIENIFNYLKVLETVDTTGISPTFSTTNLSNQTRQDIPKAGLVLDGYIIAPKTIHRE